MNDRQTLKQLNRRTYEETDDYKVWMEDIGEQLFIHVAIYNVTKEVIGQVKEAWANIMLDAWFDGYEEVFTYTKDSRIINIIGGAHKIGEHEDYEVWKWELN